MRAALSAGAVILSAALAIAMSAGTARAQCNRTILKCGCTIKGSGLFTLGSSISIARTSVDCIAISAKNAVLDLNGYTITGPDVAGSLEAGVHVLGGATGAFVEGEGATITGFRYGIEDDSSNTVIDDVVTSENGGSGVFLSKANGNTVANVIAQNNAVYGIWLSASSRNVVSNGVISGNGNSGVEVGCVNQSGKCVTVAAGSLNNAIYGMTSNDNGGNGIEVQFQSGTNVIGLCTVSGNTLNDMADRHTNGCDNDTWFANIFTSANRNCID